ncbi:type II CAAX endopeptidase family protein [Niallia oryzisoli]|uniref:Type II CAAX endopeptidase family protein n=1 Tax=Niallia oryzisoli TaxID=1737571 RepID=A0ABZ2CAT5_9BACI
MKTGLFRIISVCAINFLLNYLLLFPLGLFQYISTPDLKMFGLVGLVVSGITAIATILFYRLVDRKKINTLGFRMNNKDLLFSLTSIVVTVLLVMYVVMIGSERGVISAEWNLQVLSEGRFYSLFLLVFASWFIAALYEEILFRGYFVANLHFLTKKKLYIVSSVIFMIFHIFKGLDPVSIVVLMVMSCVLLYVYLKSGSLLPGIFAHLIYNFATSHLVGNSEIALLKYNGDLGLFQLIIIVLYILITLFLTNVFYRQTVSSTISENVHS